MKYNRRKFIEFVGKASIGTALIPPFLVSCGNTTTPAKTGSLTKETLERLKKVTLEALSASDKDDLLLTNGLKYHPVIKWGDMINDNDTFGFNNDFTCFIPLDKNNPKDGLLWVNH